MKPSFFTVSVIGPIKQQWFTSKPYRMLKHLFYCHDDNLYLQQTCVHQVLLKIWMFYNPTKSFRFSIDFIHIVANVVDKTSYIYILIFKNYFLFFIYAVKIIFFL
ncbi:hypothetical protein EDEG_02360 [Edhazardia aedis USNM 41457]|uniref:Uncharacterized protein n=1 Tax=Edhazardia aedis (strain USNM 41457) TaxID=1003232 RepID=J9D6Z2_EDHAE|nr:hypothetical protein EDEG_02360 [Edhazardia aedis USNM 41457]|eukprot:EJW03294.1 hypothetical protein EDEG_02360 [Edhazardia aedis USNM 41457]